MKKADTLVAKACRYREVRPLIFLNAWKTVRLGRAKAQKDALEA